MRFCSKKVIEYLKNPRDNLVATMRRYNYKWNQTVILKDCNGKMIGKGVVVAFYPVCDYTLRMLLPVSGFNSVEEWISEAKRLHRRLPDTVYLIYITDNMLDKGD